MFEDIFNKGGFSDFGEVSKKELMTTLAKALQRIDKLETGLASVTQQLGTLRDKTNANVTKIVTKIKEVEAKSK